MSSRLEIKNNIEFVKKILNSEPETYESAVRYAKKQLNSKATDIPYYDQEMVIHFALAKALNSYDPDKEPKTEFLTYFNYKLQGEISDYRNKRDALLRKINRMAKDGNVEYVEQINRDNQKNELVAVTNENPEDILISQDIYRRQLMAFRMAFSSLPLLSQTVLNMITEERFSTAKVADILKISSQKVNDLKTYAMTVIFMKILRSKHLDISEKKDILKQHGLSEIYIAHLQEEAQKEENDETLEEGFKEEEYESI